MSTASLACRSCGADALHEFLSLGETPLADALVPEDQLSAEELRFPLDVAFCSNCALVQILEEVPPQQLFVDNYLYFSSFSDELLRHNRENALRLIEQCGLDANSLVVEVGSNDGYMLRNFAEAGIPVLGIDPAPTQAEAAIEAGIPTVTEFFGAEIAQRLRDEGRRADVILGHNVMAHTPTLNSFVEGISILLADDGIASIENPSVRDLIEHGEFDTIYHEHFCYFSCSSIDNLVRRHGLSLNAVEHFPLHGGTLRWTIGHNENVQTSAREHLDAERAIGMTEFGFYEDFGNRVEQIRTELLDLLRGLRAEGKRIAAYGAAAKGSTLINYVGIGSDLIDFVVDRNVHKQGLHMPGVHLPIRDPAALLEENVDYVLLLAWNFRDEIIAQQDEFRRRGGRFIVPVPRPEVVA